MTIATGPPVTPKDARSRGRITRILAVVKYPNWRCHRCKFARGRECNRCHTRKDFEDFAFRDADAYDNQRRRKYICQLCEAIQAAESKQCEGCKKVKPRAEYHRHSLRYSKFPDDFKYCKACEFPQCSGCGTQAKKCINVKKETTNGLWYGALRTMDEPRQQRLTQDTQTTDPQTRHPPYPVVM